MLYLKELVRWLTEHLLKMKSKNIEFRDPVVENVVDKFVSRSNVGFAKYGRTLHSERTGKHKDLAGYLNDVQEELMDAILYIQAAREELVEANTKPEAFRPPHPSDASTAQLDWTDHVAPV
jgi:hypothetical protein